MDKSPSPHHLESLNQEDRAASMAGEGAGGTGDASPPVFLLDLPDELLVCIFKEVYRSLRPYKDKEGDVSGVLVPLSQIVVNKRIFDLARPIWFHHLTLPSGLVGDALLSELTTCPEIQPLIKSVHTEHPYAFPSLHSCAIRPLSNLTSLTLSFPDLPDPAATSYTIPLAVTRTLSSFTSLTDLKILSKPQLTFEDASFSLNKDVPSLRHFDAGDENLLNHILLHGATTLRSLTIRGALETPLNSLPWATLVSLRVFPTSGLLTLSQYTSFTLDLRYLRTPLVRLTQVVIGADCFCQPTSQHPTPFQDLLILLRPSTLERLEVRCGNMLHWPALSAALPSIKQLTIDGPLWLFEEDNLPNLWAFLGTFPSLAHLHLCNIRFSPAELTATHMADLDPSSLFLSHPALCTLLFVLRPTELLELRVSDIGETVDLRWTRCCKDEDFVREKWLLGGENNT